MDNAPKIEISGDVLFLDGIYLGRKACILICCDEKMCLDGTSADMNMQVHGSLL